MNQTPGLCAGPGVYHNMPTLCYFIQKPPTSVYQYRYFVYFHNALKRWNPCGLIVSVLINVHVFYQRLIVFVLFFRHFQLHVIVVSRIDNRARALESTKGLLRCPKIS